MHTSQVYVSWVLTNMQLCDPTATNTQTIAVTATTPEHCRVPFASQSLLPPVRGSRSSDSPPTQLIVAYSRISCECNLHWVTQKISKEMQAYKLDLN